MKKFLLPIMALALTFTFVGCGSDDDDPQPNNPNPTPAQAQYLYSFAQKTYSLADETTVTLNITNAKGGGSIIAEQDIKVTLNVVADKTTAEEGTDFVIPTKVVTIPKGKNKVTFTVQGLTAPANDKNTVVIEPKFNISNISAGRPATVELKLIGSYAKDMIGTWVMNALVTDKDAMEGTWGGMVTYDESFPAFDAEDEMAINETTFKPAFKSTLKNFFIGEATYEPVGSYSGIHVGLQSIDLSIFKLTGVNRYFSDEATSESNVAYIGIRNIVENNETLLDVYLLDYERHSFAPELLDFGMYMADGDYPYMAYQTGMYINFTMKKKAE